nr:BrnT family toxin [Paracoccus zhejiangensis]
MGQRPHVCVWTWRQPPRRIISLRKANRKEEALYAAQDLYR